MNRTVKRTAVLVAAVGLVGGGAALAAIPSTTSGAVSACYVSSGPDAGALRVIDSGASCRSTEKPLSWNAKGLQYRGAWSSSTVYYPNDVVTSAGKAYVAKLQNKTVQPANTTNWDVLVQGGPGKPVQATGDITKAAADSADTVLASLALPAWSYELQSEVVLEDYGSTTDNATCRVVGGAVDGGEAFTTALAGHQSEMTTLHLVTLSKPVTMTLRCQADTTDDSFYDATLLATPTG